MENECLNFENAKKYFWKKVRTNQNKLLSKSLRYHFSLINLTFESKKSNTSCNHVIMFYASLLIKFESNILKINNERKKKENADYIPFEFNLDEKIR